MKDRVTTYLSSLLLNRVAMAFFGAFLAAYFKGASAGLSHIDPNEAITLAQLAAVLAAPMGTAFSVGLVALGGSLVVTNQASATQDSGPANLEPSSGSGSGNSFPGDSGNITLPRS